MSDDATSDYSSPLGRQAAQIIDEDTDWVDLAAELDPSIHQRRDAHEEWHPSKPFRPMFLSYLWAVVEGDSLSGIPDRLEDQPALADAFGFDHHDLPDDSTFRRLRSNRFEDLTHTINRTAEEIRNIGNERGSSIGFTLLDTDDQDDDSGPSNRTVDRLIRRKSKEVLKELQAVAFPAINLPRPDDPVYDEDELLTLEAFAAIHRMAANGAGTELGDEKNPDPNPYTDPFYEDGPSGETLLESLKELDVDEIAKLINWALRKTYTRARPRLREISRESQKFERMARVAIDITCVAYYGERDELVWVQGAPDDKEFDWCHKFATAIIVGDNIHFTLGVCPLGNPDRARNSQYGGTKEKSWRAGVVVRKLLGIVNEFVNIDLVYADRGFFAADVIAALDAYDCKYVIPVPIDQRLKPELRRMNTDRVNVKNDWVIHGPVKGKPTNQPVRTNLVVLPPDEDDPVHNDKTPQPFATNAEVKDQIDLDRRRAKRTIERYQARAAIENSYKKFKECAAWTTSKVFEVRWFHFGFAAVVYNMWLLVDFLVQDRIGVITVRSKPRVTLRRFLKKLQKELVRLL